MRKRNYNKDPIGPKDTPGIKKYECGLCKGRIDSKTKKEKKFVGNRKDVRKHLRESHNIKGATGRNSGGHKGFSIDSDLTKNTIVHDFN